MLAPGLPPAAVLPIVDDLLLYARRRLVKAALPGSLRARAVILAEAQAELAADLADWYGGLLARAGVRKDAAIRFEPDADVDWDEERRRLRIVLERSAAIVGAAAWGAVGEQLAVELRFDLEAPATAGIRNLIGVHVAGITDTLRDQLRRRVEDAIDRGLSVDQLVRGTVATPGLRDLFGARAQVIALTETAIAYNEAAAAGYRESGLVDAVEIFDGPDCGWDGHDDPDLADGSIRSLDEYEATPISHPNCQRSAAPVVMR